VLAWDSLAAAVVTGTALLLAAVALRSWSLRRSGKALLLATAFALLLVQGLLLSGALFSAPSDASLWLGAGLAAEAVALVLLYVAVLRPA
jgi:hypothetical protein